MKSDYSKKLEHPKWARVSAAIKEAANWKCENCHSGEKNLQVHHSIYVKGWEPWDYDHSTLICLCVDCHIQRQQLDATLRYAIAQRLRHVPNRRLEKVVWEILEQALKEQ